MALKDTLKWMTSEWAILASGDQMTLRDRARWISHWVPFGMRTVGYGSVSITLGPVTPDHQASLWAMKRWSRSSMGGLGIFPHVDGEENVPDGAFVYASNHQSLLDILVLGGTLPGDFKWAAKRSLMKIPFLGWHLKLAGHVPVDRRGGKRGAVDAIERFERVLRDGKQLLIFPEGTRSEDGEVKPFKTGGFYAAVRANKPVVPVAIDGTHRAMGKGAADMGSWAGRADVYVSIGEPIYPLAEGSQGDKVADLRDRTREAVCAMFERIRLAPPADDGDTAKAADA